jgi:hypothetical protein
LEEIMEMEQAVAKRPRRDLSGYAALIVALTGLGTALWRKPPEEAAKAGYIELTTAIIESQAAEKQNHEDIVALRTYLENYSNGHEAVVTPVPTASTAVPRPFVAPAPTTVVVHAIASAAPPPPIAPQAVAKRIKSPDAISW